MDIGNQQRVIIVELDKTTPVEPVVPAADDNELAELEMAVEWPLPLEIEPVS